MIDWGKIFRIAAAAAAVILVTVIIVLTIQMGRLKSRFSDSEDFYRASLENQRMTIDQMSQNLQILASGSNEVRRYMSLPEKQLIRGASDDGNKDSVDPAVSFYDAFRYLVSQEEEENLAAAFSLWLEEGDIQEYFSSRNFSFNRINGTQAAIMRDGEEMLTLYWNSGDSAVEFSDVAGNRYSLPFDDEPDQTLNKASNILDTYTGRIREREDYLNRLTGSSEIADVLKSRGLAIEAQSASRYNLINLKDESFMDSIGRRGMDFYAGNESFSDESAFRQGLIEFISEISIETESERIDKLVLAKMEEVFADEGFKVLLESENCQRELQREEDGEFVYFHIFRNDGTVKGSYALQKEFGEVLLISGDGKYLKSLDRFTPDNDFRSLVISDDKQDNSSPFALDDSSDTFLVVGTHEHNADTMIIVHADNISGKIKMISFPRDLYYKGSKINNIYKEQGPEQLAKELSEITGYSIKKYISIDMFAFIDVINILGGIDVTLESDLIDPTYKVKNNGVWSTLYYRKGTHHLDGVAALRVARSRHGSEAYDRSRRQQLIVKAIMDRLNSLGASDMSTFYDFVTSVFSYIDTNLTIADLAKSFVMYKDNEIDDPVTLNLDNILVARWSNTYLLPIEEEKKLLADDNFFAGQWIVVPRDNDWDLFNKFIGNVLNNGN
ncbi:LCP family protein [Spirochaeta isovalerica]|uniref:LCP family protein required for cell wall assembly n=1 Tax=Spirochaeta isovalerica TaxID=150 RepID=A0A841R5X8_9SPIO|nr:LCP family protein [Spirochaeta isovalerica]MBB6478557.1 LCP family protein required for cell wall assembly [Spirochaeta isovalerica]